MKKIGIILTSILFVVFISVIDNVTGALYFVGISFTGFWVLLYGFFHGITQNSKDALLFCTTPLLTIIFGIVGYLIGNPIYQNICENNANKFAKEVILYHQIHHCYPEKLENIKTYPSYINTYLYSKTDCDNVELHCITIDKYYDFDSKTWYEKSSGVRLEDFLLIPD